jgi:hypothetical protein
MQQLADDFEVGIGTIHRALKGLQCKSTKRPFEPREGYQGTVGPLLFAGCVLGDSAYYARRNTRALPTQINQLGEG